MSHGARAVTALAAAAAFATAGDAPVAVAVAVAVALMLLSGASALASRRAWRLAARGRVGAESEALVRKALAPLAHEGWRIRHAIDWPGRGDLDHVARAPTGDTFVIETKTQRYTRGDLARVAETARLLARPRRRHPHGVRPVICLARARRLERVAHNDVLVVSPDWLVRALLRDGPARWAAMRSTAPQCSQISIGTDASFGSAPSMWLDVVMNRAAPEDDGRA